MWAVARFYAYFLTASSIQNFGDGSMPIYDKGQTSNILATSRTTAMARWDKHSRAIPGNRKYPFCQFCFCIPLFLQNVSKCGVIMSHHVESTHSGASPQHFSTNPADPCQSVANTSMTPSPGLARTTLRPPGRGKEHQGTKSKCK